MKLSKNMNTSDSPDRIEYIRTEVEFKDWTSEEVQELNSSLKLCCIPLPRRIYLFIKYVAPTLILLTSFAADIFSDVAVAARHYADGHYWWFSLTLVFVCAPAVMFITHAIILLILKPDIHLPKKLVFSLLYICTAAGFLLWPLWSYLKKLYHASRAVLEQDKSMEHLEKFHSSGAGMDNMHKMFKAFLESAPQLLLQLYILLSSPPQNQDSHTVAAQVISIILSLNALSIVVVDCQVNSKHHPSRAPSTAQSEEAGELCCVIVEYLWWFFSISARVLALAFFASVFKSWVFLFCAIHAGTISACLLCNNPNNTPNSVVSSIFMGIVFIFCFVEYKVDFGTLGKVLGLYCLYYGFTFCQNMCMILSAYFLAEEKYSYHLPLVVSHFTAFILGIICMLFYLGMLRPFYLKFMKNKGDPPVQ